MSRAQYQAVCILTGASGENADDCTTHAHEIDAEQWAVVETRRDGNLPQIEVKLRLSEKDAQDLAVGMALENTGYTEEEIREHLYAHGVHEEGDWGVAVIKAG